MSDLRKKVVENHKVENQKIVDKTGRKTAYQTPSDDQSTK
jgi:hypothetical protein